MTKNLLIVWHSRTGCAKQMAYSALQGAKDVIQELQADEQLTLNIKPAAEVNADDLIKADGYLFCAPENLAALSGEMKEFFDRNYYHVLDQLNGRPYVLLIAAGSDGEMAAKQAQRIAVGWRLNLISPHLIINTDAQTAEAILAPKNITESDKLKCAELGGLLAATLL